MGGKGNEHVSWRERERERERERKRERERRLLCSDRYKLQEVLQPAFAVRAQHLFVGPLPSGLQVDAALTTTRADAAL
jgi:hypothetical protein